MKIYFIGAESCGKSTLARYTSEYLKLPLIPEVARMILSEQELQVDSLRSNIEVVNKFQKDIFSRQLEEERKRQAFGFVSDRSFDCVAYAAQFSTIFHEIVETKEFKDYLESLKQKDVQIFFVRPQQATMKNDGVRETLSWERMIAIDAMIKLMLELYQISYISIQTDIMQERVRLIKYALKARYVPNHC